MLNILQKMTPLLLIFAAFTLVEAGLTVEYAEGRSRLGGRSFRSIPKKKAPAPSQLNKQQTPRSTFGRGLAGGLLGGALGGLLFGSLFGMGGNGMGILPLLLLGIVGYMLYKRVVQRPVGNSSPGYQPPPSSGTGQSAVERGTGFSLPPIREATLEDGLQQIRQFDPAFDPAHFVEVASDVFFKVQAGWMRRDLASYRHLLGDTLADEYASHFEQMRRDGQINKLESIAIRKIEIVDAGSDGAEDFVTVLFTANLLDYTVDDTHGEVLEGSTTEPVKFAEQWTWARAVRTEEWKLEGIAEDA